MTEKAEPRPSSLIKKIMFITVIIEAIAGIPQAVGVYTSQDAGGVSLPTWLLYCVLSVVWLIYSVNIKDKLIFLYSCLSFLTEVSILVGIVMYG